MISTAEISTPTKCVTMKAATIARDTTGREMSIEGHGATYWHAPTYHGAWYASALPSIALGSRDRRRGRRPPY